MHTCVLCGYRQQTIRENNRCEFCARIAAGLKHKQALQYCARVCAYKRLRQMGLHTDIATELVQNMPRPISSVCNAPQCSSNTESNERWTGWRNRRMGCPALPKATYKSTVDSPCTYCGYRRAGGIDRVGLGCYTEQNIVPSCEMCNKSKSVFNVNDWYKHLERVIQNHEPAFMM